MHINNLVRLKKFVSVLEPGTVLDIGSYDLHGYNAREVLREWVYTGCDKIKGPNVDTICDAKPIGVFDLVISLNAIEHCEDPFEFFRYAVSNMKIGSYLFIMAPFSFEYHRHPIDCWRFTPDSFSLLCKRYNVTLLESKITRGSYTITATLSDIIWKLKRRSFLDAFKIMLHFPNRITHYDCHMIGTL